MKILAVGLDCAAPELLLGEERLENIRRLMDAGCYGPLESIVPPITVPAWMCMATGQDPGALGVYGFRNRADHSYAPMRTVHSRSIGALSIWDQIAREGGRSILLGIPPGYPPRKVNGLSVSCFLTPQGERSYTHPPELAGEIERLVGTYPFDVAGFRTQNKPWLRDEIHAMTRAHFTVARHLLERSDWEYFQLVEIGLDRMQHGFWKYHDPAHLRHEPGNPYCDVIRDYYVTLDEELGRLLERIDDETAVLVLSDHGAQRLDGGFCVNEWLVREGFLVLNRYPEVVTPFDQLDVDWERTRAWGDGGYYARIFLNVAGREPRGALAKADVERFRNDLKAALEATADAGGRPLGTLVFKPEEIYRTVNNVAPDLIVHFGGLRWRSVGGVGYRAIHIPENDTGPDDCNHAQHGAFVLAAPGLPPQGAIEGARLLDMAPTLLELAGHDVPCAMQGRSLVTGSARRPWGPADAVDFDDPSVRDRLSGLGYIA
jgi:predicted AlkP superfamily phosphohydrolase/phosphomutase